MPRAGVARFLSGHDRLQGFRANVKIHPLRSYRDSGERGKVEALAGTRLSTHHNAVIHISSEV